MRPVSRAYEKLKYALDKFNIDLDEKICADFGSSTGGFVQCLLEFNAGKVYSIETSKNRLHFMLKEDKRVIVMDRTNAMHVKLPEKVDFISIDVGWTKQKNIIPNAVKNLKENGEIVSLIKPQYEAEKDWLNKTKVKEEYLGKIMDKVKEEIKNYVDVIEIIESPIKGEKAGNKEFLMHCRKKI